MDSHQLTDMEIVLPRNQQFAEIDPANLMDKSKRNVQGCQTMRHLFLILCLLCMASHAQVIQITCPTRTVPGTYTNQTNAGYIVETVTTPVINGSQSHYYNSGITNLPNVFKNVPAECTIRTNYRQATLKILRPRAIRIQ